MRAVVQRVTSGRVLVDDEVTGRINKGLVILLGIADDDTEKDMVYMAEKIINLRVFEDNDEKMNLSLLDVEGSLLVVSQFTLYGDCRRGNRPSFTKAARSEVAEELYNSFVNYIRNKYNINVETGRFQTTMMVEINNYGPVTILLDSRKEF